MKRVSERLPVVRVIVGRSVYAPQTGRSVVEKEDFLAKLGEVVSGKILVRGF